MTVPIPSPCPHEWQPWDLHSFWRDVDCTIADRSWVRRCALCEAYEYRHALNRPGTDTDVTGWMIPPR